MVNKVNPEIYIPDGKSADEALAKTTHLAVSAHEDDIEFMAYDGILRCRRDPALSFTAVVLGDGAGSPRAGKYASFSDADMKKIRKEEQKAAARAGGYGALVFLDLPSARIKDASDIEAVTRLSELVKLTRPRVVYTHNLADRHDTHVAAALRLIAALRAAEYVPEKLYGCEVWRSLDWVNDDEKVLFDVGGDPALERALLSVFDSQIAGGKAYDDAVVGRRRANATFGASHDIDRAEEIAFAVDMTELARTPSLSPATFTLSFIDRFRADVEARIGRLG